MVVTARMGAGHDGAAAELRKRLEAMGVPTQSVDFLDASPLAGRLLKVVYEAWLRWAPWAYEATYRVWFIAPLLCSPLVWVLSMIFGRRLQRWAARYGATVVVSTYPLASVALGHMRRRRLRRFGIPVITFVTDFASHPLWVHKGVDLHLCVHPVTAAAVEKATGSKAVATGPMVAQAFREGLADKAEARSQLGIPADAEVVLVVAGSWGVGKLESTFDTLAATGRFFPVAACGKNERLRRRLSQRPGGMAIGWTDQMPLLMAAADVVVQNAGGLTSMEAFAAGLPVVTYLPIPGHGRENAVQMEAAGVASFAHSPKHLMETISEAIATRELRAARGRSIFLSDPAISVAAVADQGPPLRAPKQRSLAGRAAAAAVAATLGWSGLNVAAGGAATLGVGTIDLSGPGTAAYVAVRMGASNISDPHLAALLSQQQISAVVEGDLAATNPGAVHMLSTYGVDVVNGGWGSASQLHVLGQSGIAKASMALRQDLGYQVDLLAPDQPLSGVDLTIAGVQKMKVLDPVTTVPPTGPIPQAVGNRVYVLDAEGLSAQKTIERLQSLLASLEKAGLRPQSMEALA